MYMSFVLVDASASVGVVLEAGNFTNQDTSLIRTLH